MSNRFVDAAVGSGFLVHPDQAQGCCDEQIAEVQALWTRPLPKRYVEFLAGVGKGLPGMWVGTDVFYPRILWFGSWIKRMRKEGMPIPEEAILISSHQGYGVQYVLASEGDDPQVYSLQEYHEAVPGQALSEMFINAIRAAGPRIDADRFS